MKSWVLFASCISLSCCPAFGQQRPETPADNVDVYMDFDGAFWDVMGSAETLVSDTFAKVGVNIKWHAGSPPKNYRSDAGRTIFSIRWAERVPATSSAGALAVARPLSPEASITLYEESLRRFLNRYRDTQNIVFGYVVAHELAHLMQGLNRHSDSGILKAQWSYKDIYQMASGSLDFTAYDVELIHDGLNARMSRRQTLALKAAGVQGVQVAQNRE
jgi:hypothetical protein